MLNKKFMVSLVVLSCFMLCTVTAEAAVIGQWDMDEGSGTTAYDSSSSGSDFAGIGSGYSWISPGSDGSGSALSVPVGTDSYLQTNSIPTAGENAISYQMSIEATIRPTGKDTSGSQIAALYNGFNFTFHGTIDLLRFIPCNSWTWVPAADAYGVEDLLFDGNWHTVKGVFNGIPNASGEVYSAIEIDGVEVTRTYLDTGGVPLHIGHLGATASNFFIGTNWINPGGAYDNYFGDIDNVILTNVPEPATVSLLVLGSLALLRRRKA